MNFKDTTIESYDKNATEFSIKFKQLMEFQKLDEFPTFLNLLKGPKILDLGCGAGDHTLFFKEQGFQAIGIDLSESMIQLCKKKGIDAEVMDIENLTFSNNTFDGIWATTSLLHIEKKNITPVIKKMYDILKKEGTLHVCVKKGRGEELIFDKNSSQKRFFAFWEEEELIKQFEPYFEVIKSQVKTFKNIDFLNIFFQKKN
jgi:ubiquinone/menaquinone biosynthesis C-methylase UbiE